jgi:hypothetical protein
MKKKTFKTGETWKINKCNYKLTVLNTLYLKKCNNDVCLADTFLGCGDSVNWQFR